MKTLTPIEETMVTKARALRDYAEGKEKFHHGKWSRARKFETGVLHYKLMCKYLEHARRISDVIQSLVFGHDYFYTKGRWAVSAYKGRISGKEERRQKFLNNYRYAPWFMSDSLGADYGTYTCDRCGSSFHHSPSTLKRGVETVYQCCCGYCINSYFSNRPYS